MDIPPEIITDILRRLPAKTLGRFKSVSKNWQALISEPQFINRHLNTLTRTHLLCDYNYGAFYSIPLTHLDQFPDFTLSLPRGDSFFFHGSCNGLVLESVHHVITSHSKRYSLVVFNPTTTEYIELPRYEMLNDWFKCDYICGFGYDSFTDDYKIVMVTVIPNDKSVHVYSLRNDAWRRVMDYPYDHFHGKGLPVVFVDGFLYWIAVKRCDLYYVPVIVGFNLGDETLSEVSLPNWGKDVDIVSESECELVVVGEKLGLFMEDEVWLMNKNGVRKSWSKIVIDGLEEMGIEEPNIIYENGKILLPSYSNDLMWVYDVEEKSFCNVIQIDG